MASMDRARKLRRYQRKEYDQVVAFPVEIVGRDGVIRRYSFEASVRLYQRRIASASSRYVDSAVVSAEVQHCQLRIGQLRRSYLKRYGWENFDAGPSVGEGEFAGEIVAFLRRFVGEGRELDGLDVRWVQKGGFHHLYFVEFEDDSPPYLLYLFPLDGVDAQEGREAFFRLLRVVGQSQSQDAESLVAFHHTADCAQVLTGVGAEPSEGLMESLSMGEEGPSRAESGLHEHYLTGLRLLSMGELDSALHCFEKALQERPFLRKGYVASAEVADRLGRATESEVFARLGLHHFASDAVLQYQLGLALFRQGRDSECREALALALQRVPDLYPALVLLGLTEILAGSLGRATRNLARADRIRHVEASGRALKRVWAGLKWRRHFLVLGTGSTLVCLLAALQGWPMDGCTSLAGVAWIVGLALLPAWIRREAGQGDALRGSHLPLPEALGEDAF